MLDAQDSRSGHAHVVQEHLADAGGGVLVAHLGKLVDSHTGGVAIDQEHRRTAMDVVNRRILGDDDDGRSFHAAGGVVLAAVDDRGVAVPRVGRLHAGHVGAGGGLGDAQGQRRPARDVRLHVLLDLLGRAELAHVVHRGHAHGVERGKRAAVAGDGEVGQGHRHEVDVGAAHFFRQAQAREAGLGHGLPSIPGELAVAIAFALLFGRHLALEKLFDAFDEQFLFLGLREIDHFCASLAVVLRGSRITGIRAVENGTSSDRRRSWRSAFH